jgi:hypothetical protein
MVIDVAEAFSIFVTFRGAFLEEQQFFYHNSSSE